MFKTGVGFAVPICVTCPNLDLTLLIGQKIDDIPSSVHNPPFLNYLILQNAWVFGVEIKKVTPNILSKIIQIPYNSHNILTLLVIANLALPWYGDCLARYLELSHEILSSIINKGRILHLQFIQFLLNLRTICLKLTHGYHIS